jgi:hypothetical protein
MKIKTDDLIKELVAGLKPVQFVKFGIIDSLKVVTAGLLCVFSAVATLGLRVDIGDQILTAKFIFDTAVLALLGLLSILAAFSLSVPSKNNQKIFRLPIFVCCLILAATGYSFITTSSPFLYLGHGFSCVYEITAISILPAAILFYSIRRAAVLKRDIVGILVLLSGVSFGLLGVQFTCTDSTPLHLLIWHVLPSAIVMAFGIWLSRRLIKKI